MPGAARAGVAFLLALGLMVGALLLAAPAADGDPTVDVIVQLCLAGAVAAGLVVLLTPAGPDLTAATRGWLVVALVGAFLATGATLVLSGSDFPPLGVALDQGFRAASVTKYAHTVELVDFAYRDLPAFYPPLFFWVLGRGATWLGVEPYEALKTGVLLSALVAPIVSFALWRRVTRDVTVALAVAGGALAFQDWYEPYAWLAVVAFVPWWLRFVLQVGAPAPARPATIVGASLVGAAILCTYHYFFFAGMVQLGLALALRRPAARAGVELGPRRGRETALVLGGTAVVSAVYWLPLLVSVLSTPGVRSMQTRYLDATQVDVPMPFLEFDLVGWLTLIGLGYLALAMFRSELAAALASLLAAAYVWFLLGDVGILVDEPLLNVRTSLLVEVVLLAGAALALVYAGRAVARSRPLVARYGATAVRGPIVVGAVVVVFALGVGAVSAIPYVSEQRAATEPVTMLDTFERATRGEADGTVVLTDREELPEYLPVYVFNVWNAHYSHPAAEFGRRAAFLDRLARVRDPDVFAAALRHNRYDHVDSIALVPTGGSLPYTFFDDAFPRGVSRRTITFSTGQFDAEWFARRGSRALAVYVPRDADPLDALDDDQLRTLRGAFRGDLEGVSPASR